MNHFSVACKAHPISPVKARLQWPGIFCQSSSVSHLIGWVWQMVAH